MWFSLALAVAHFPVSLCPSAIVETSSHYLMVFGGSLGRLIHFGKCSEAATFEPIACSYRDPQSLSFLTA